MQIDDVELELAVTEQLRGRLGDLMGAAQMLSPLVLDQESREYDCYMAMMDQSICRMLRLTEHLELAAQLRLGILREQKEVIDAAELCRELCLQVEGAARPLGTAFGYEQEGPDTFLYGDRTMLSRMLLSLVDNALRAAGPEGHAGVRLSMDRKQVKITVWDDGPGMPGGEPAPKQDLKDLLTDDGRGLGLSLELVRRMAANWGGRLMIEQGEGVRGLRAVLSLPAGEPESGVLRTPKSRFDASAGLSPVLVELSDILPSESYLPQDLEG